MGRIKELQDKQAKGDITDDEKKELSQLLKEAGVPDPTPHDVPLPDENEDEGKMIEDLAEKLSDAFMGKVTSKMDKKDKSDKPKVEKTVSPRMIVDKSLGEVSVDVLAETKIKLPNREGKKHTEVSMKTVHFLNALVTGDQQKLQVLVEGTGARGGFLVPDDFANIIVEDLRDQSVMRQIATVIQTDSDTLHLPSLASRPQAQWRSEGATKATSTVDFGENVFTPYSLAVIVGLSNELVADASLGVNGSIVNYVAQVMATAIREKEEEAYVQGSGSGQPTGFTTYTYGSTGAGSSDATRADAIITAYFALPQAYRRRAVWVGNASTLGELHKLKDAQNNYLMSSLSGTTQESIKGRPIFEQNDVADGELYFGDFSYYYIVDRDTITTRVSDEATVASQSAFERNLTFVRVEHRTDAEMTLTRAVRKVTGL